jgi:hypothetical protein
LVKDKNGDLLADFHNILNRWKNYFCHILNVYGINDITQTEINASKSLLPAPSRFEVEFAIEN